MKRSNRDISQTRRQLTDFDGKPTVLLHSCCAPCSTAVLETLLPLCDPVLFYYNPNIYPVSEYNHRLDEQKRLAGLLNIRLVEGKYDPERFEAAVIANHLENEPEGGKRCALCFGLRLRETAAAAKALHCDFFTTTLTISPHKNAKLINEIAENIAEESGVSALYGDFKKQNGYLRSIQLSKEYGLYRQDYCGCKFAQIEHEKPLDF
jgi:predicted adenine nucleotide alpha hydrolase (AANH) superfamily ATPase